MEPPTANLLTETYLTEFFEGFIHMEFSQENFPSDVHGECGTFFDNNLGIENLTEDSVEFLVSNCAKFIVENSEGLNLLNSLGHDAFYCGQGFSLACRGDEFAFVTSKEAPKEILRLNETAKTFGTFVYDFTVEGISVYSE